MTGIMNSVRITCRNCTARISSACRKCPWCKHDPRVDPVQLGDCCGAPVVVRGRTTQHWECTRCGEPCDLQHTPDGES